MIAFRNESVTLMPYDVYFTAEAEAWMMALEDNDYNAIMAAWSCSRSAARASAARSSTASRAAGTRA